MASVDLVVRNGDDQPVIKRTLSENITGFNDNNFVLYQPDDGTVVDTYPVTVDDPVVATTEFTFDPTPDAGFYFGKYVLVNTNDSKQMTIPNSIPLSVLVTDDSISEYSYSGDPSLRDIDKIRFLLGDTDMNKAMMSDREITFLVTEYVNPYLAASEAALIVSSRWANFKDKTVGPLSIKYGDMVSRYITIADSLKNRARNNSGALAITTQVVRDPIFKIGMNDNPPLTDPKLGGAQS